jgi:hypothetical protein
MTKQKYLDHLARKKRFEIYLNDLEELYKCAAQWLIENQSQPTGDCEGKKIEN